MNVKANIYWILAALALAIFSRTFLVSIYKIPTISMAPTFWPGDFILTSQLAYGVKIPALEKTYFKSAPARGDLVVFQFLQSKAREKSGIFFIKRIVAVAGDEIEIQNSRVTINGSPCTYTKNAQNLSVTTFAVFEENCQGSQREVILSTSNGGGPLGTSSHLKVPDAEVFVLGDNRDTSDDSRDLGSVPVDQIRSKVSAIWLSYGSTQDFISGSNTIRWNRILTKPR